MKKHFIILSVYIILALVMSLPLALNFSSAIPGVEGDAPSYVWALGWAKRALELNADLFHTDFIFYPLGGATQLLWSVALIAFLSLPLQYAFDLIAAHNVMWLAATVMSGYGMFLLAESVIANGEIGIAKKQSGVSQLAIRNSQFASFTAGLVFAFAPLRLGYGLAFLNLFNTQFIPFYLLFLFRAARASKTSLRASESERSNRRAAITSPLTNNQRRDIFLAGLFLGVNAYIDFQIAAFLGLFSALYALYEFIALATRGRARANGRADYFALTRTFAAIALTALVIAAPMLGIIANDFAIEGGDYIRVFKMEYSAARSYDLAMFFIPSARSALYANVPLKIPGVNTGQTVDDVGPLSPDRQVFLGFTALALALIGYARGGRAARFWIFIAAAFALFSLGPALHLWGQDTRVPLPYLILHEIPILNHIRIPMRYGVMMMIAVAMLAGLGVEKLKIKSGKSKVQSRMIFSFLTFAVLLESAVLPYPIQSVAMPRVYADLARVPGDFSILEIPTFNWRAAAAIEVYQAIHGKRILRAYSNRVAPSPAEYFSLRGTPIVMRSLRILEGAEKGFLTNAELAEDKRARDPVIAFFDLRYALIHRDWLTPDDTRALDAYLREVLDARVFSDDGTVIAYELPRARVASTTQIDLRENIGQLYAGRGWQFEYPQANWEGQFNFVWTRGARSEIYFRAADARDQTLTIRAYAAEPQRVQIALNGTRVAELTLTREWKDYRVTLPARSMIAMNRVDFIFDTDLQETVGVTTIEIK